MASFTVATGLGIWVATHAAEMRALRAELLGRRELQERLLRPDSDTHAPFPHSVREIGFVLNPGLGETSWMADEHRYAINSLGLRGGEIPPRRPGVKRVLLVGDSMFFGWRLPDEDAPGRRLTAYAAAKGLDSAVEFITVALPSWNVRSERAFLDHHLDRLDPDYVIWSLLQNDLEDVPGAVPPGVLTAWNSPQRAGPTAFGFQNTRLWDLAMPAVVARWEVNLSAIRGFHERHGIPTAIVWWTPSPRQHFLQWASERNGFELPRIVVPEDFRFDRRWSLSDLDPHPTGWATRILAMGITSRIAELGWIPTPELSENEAAVGAAFREQSLKRFPPQRVQTLISKRLGKIATGYRDGRWDGMKSALFGLDEGNMGQNGILYLRDPGSARALQLRIATPGSPARSARKLTLQVRNRQGRGPSKTFALPPGSAEMLAVALPETTSPERVFEIEWRFDGSDCDGPSSCTSGRLESAGFTAEPTAAR